ncbi:DNA replication regulator SLD3-domain-containing protein [Lipomyces chichibuensis]|uniref:DNA replication regulator SLD3-domain-containing protein n=1 Tax=Lipomyces chichibuensis TaxID=1546026 RepID=UPI003343135B
MSSDAGDTDAHVQDELEVAGIATVLQNIVPQPIDPGLPVSPMQRKRKHVEPVPEYMNSFLIYPFQENALSPPLSITPIKAAPRDHVPISILSNSVAPLISSSSAKMKKSHDLCATMPRSRPFQMHIPGLDNKVLFARVDEGKCLAAIERVGKHIYMLTMLPDHVKVKHIRAMAKNGRLTSSSSPMADVSMRKNDGNIPEYATLDEDSDKFWRAIGVDFQETRVPNREVAALFESFSMAPPMPTEHVTKESESQKPETAFATSATIKPLPAPKNSSAHELLKHIQSLYFEALYISKSPLTYFVKLTLARFRTVCKDKPEKIIEVLHHMILTVGESDYKYKSGLPHNLLELENAHGMDEATVGLFNPNDPVSEIPIPVTIAQSTVGLSSLDHERQYIQRWWNMDEDVRLPKLRPKRIDEIKKRETKLQAILALEILAQQHSLTTGATDPAGSDTTTKAKSKKKRAEKHDSGPNLNLLLDVLFDRLYIWQTVSSLDFIIATPEQRADEVREFCLEVVVPFYGSRVPKQTERLLKRCGGEKPIRDVPSSPMDVPTQVKKIKQEESSSPIVPTKKSGSSHKNRSSTAPGMTARPLSSSILKFATVASDLGVKGRKTAAIRGGLLVSNKTLERRQIDITTKKK